MIKLIDLTKYFLLEGLENIVLEDMNAKFEPGHSYAIKGFSGTGKSTLINLISGIEKPTSGKVLFEGKEVSKFSEKEHSEFLLHDIGLIFQFPFLIPEFTVLENVATKALASGMPKNVYRSRAVSMLETVGLEGRVDDSPHTLSGGEKQRVSLLRALFLKPKFLLGDELTSNLDEDASKSILEMIEKLRRKYNMGVLICSHDPVVINQMEEVFELDAGKLKLVKKYKEKL